MVVSRLMFAILIVSVAAFVPTFTMGREANEIPISSVERASESSLTQPTGAAWNETVPVEIPLASAPSTVPNANDTSIENMTVQAAHTDQQLFIRMSWNDATRDDNNSTTSRYPAPQLDSFGDAAAVQLPANTSTQPGIAMGSPQALVNVWWWNGQMGTQELIAGGAGTTTTVNDTNLTSSASYTDGRWSVVFTRNLTVDGENQTEIESNRDLDVAFAVWNGSNGERSGHKAVSEWKYLALGPGPQGPPYTTILWAIAGLAIMVVIVVTATAVRQGGS